MFKTVITQGAVKTPLPTLFTIEKFTFLYFILFYIYLHIYNKSLIYIKLIHNATINIKI